MLSVRNLSEIECFLVVAETGSFTAAAKKLKCSKNSVSRFVSGFEERLGDKLLRRTTREVHLTSFGEFVLRKCQTLWESLNQFETDLGHSQVEVQGTLRVLASDSLAEMFLHPHLQEFQRKYPKVKVELIFEEDEIWDLDKNDINILFGLPHIPHLTNEWRPRKLGKVVQQLVVQTKLYKEHGSIKKPEDLFKYPFINHVARRPQTSFKLKNSGVVKVPKPSIVVNSFRHQNELCKQGLGVCLGPKELVEDEIKSGILTAVFPELDYVDFDLFIFCRPEEYQQRKVRAFMNSFSSIQP